MAPSGRRNRIGLVVCLAAVLSAFACCGAASAQPAATLARAQSLYDHARYEDAIRELEPFHPPGVSELTAAGRELLARCYVGAGRRERGRAMFVEMLRADSTYRPDAGVLRPEEVGVFNDAMGELRVGSLRRGERSEASLRLELGLGFNGGAFGFRGVEPGAGVSVPFGGGNEARVSLVHYARGRDLAGAPPGATGREHSTCFAALLDVVRPLLPDGAARNLRALAGAGLLAGVRYQNGLTADTDASRYVGTGFEIHAGLEGRRPLRRGLALTARALARFARAPITSANDPQGFDLNLSGGSVSVALQWAPGGAGP